MPLNSDFKRLQISGVSRATPPPILLPRSRFPYGCGDEIACEN